MAHTHHLHVPKSSDIEPGNDYPTEQASVLPSPRSITERGPLGYWPKALSTPWLLFFLCFVLVLISAPELAARILPANSRQNVLDLRSGGDGILERRLLATLFPNGTTDDHVTSGISAQTFATQEWHSTLNQSGKAGPRTFVPLTSTMTMSMPTVCPLRAIKANGHVRSDRNKRLDSCIHSICTTQHKYCSGYVCIMYETATEY